MIENGIIPAATSVAERKTQLRDLFERSGMFTFVRNRDGESDIYSCNYCDVRKARIDYRLRGMWTHSSYHSGWSKAYFYPKSFDDSGLGVPSSDVCVAIGNSNSTDSPPILGDYNSSFSYVIVKNINSSYININGYRMIGVRSSSGKKMQSTINDVSYLGTYTLSSNFETKFVNIVSLRQTQYGFSNLFTLDNVKTHDRLIQHLMPMDYQDISVATMNGNFLCNDAVLDLFSFSNSGISIGAEQIYTDIDTGIKYLCVHDRTLLKLD